MRIIAGKWGGRTFDSPRGHKTHPMSDKAKGAIFNALGDISGLTVLDAFAGSGALSFEAISRGASSVIAIESDRAAQSAIQNNIRSLNMGRYIKLISASASAWLSTNVSEKFDIVIADPPYDNLQISLLNNLALRLTQNGIFVLSWPGHDTATDFDGVELVKQKDYGDIQLLFYKSIS